MNDLPAIIGVAIPRISRSLPEESANGLLVTLIEEALADAGIEKREINGACIDWPGPGGSTMGGSSNWARHLGAPLNWVIEGGLDAVGIRAILNAAAVIQSGLCETVLIAAATAGGHPSPPTMNGISSKPPAILEFADPYGAGMMQRFALTARRHMHEYGTRPEHLAEVAATIRNFGHANPEAIMYGRGPYTIEDVLSSRVIAEPLHLLDCGIVGQGGTAVIVTGGQRARALSSSPVYILSGAIEISQGPHSNPSLLSEDGMLGAQRMRVAFERAGITPNEIDLLSAYDATSFEVIRTVEMLGFCGEGEGGPFVEGGTLGPDGRLPTNPDGGLLSHGSALTSQLLMNVVEAVRQLRGSCGARQLKGPETAVVTNSVPTAHHIEALILAKEPN